VDLGALAADPALVDRLGHEELFDVLDRCGQERDRLAVVERRVQARLRRELPVMGLRVDDFPTDDDACLDDNQVGRFLQVPGSHAADLRRRGDLPEVSVGGKYKRVRLGDLRAYILRQRAIGAGTQR
jgi:hypothetical protein